MSLYLWKLGLQMKYHSQLDKLARKPLQMKRSSDHADAAMTWMIGSLDGGARIGLGAYAA